MATVTGDILPPLLMGRLRADFALRTPHTALQGHSMRAMVYSNRGIRYRRTSAGARL